MSETAGHQLDQVEHERIFKRKILPVADLVVYQQQATPTAIVLVRPPGASAHGLAYLARRELRFDVLSISDEELVEYHPQIALLRQNHPYLWPEKVRTDAVLWGNRLIMEGVQQRVNLLVDMPTETDNMVALVEHLFNRRYRVEVRGLVTHRLQSELAMHQRFARSLEVSGCGRHVLPAVSDATDEQLPATLDNIYEDPRVTIRLFDWQGKALYDSRDQGRLPSKALALLREQAMKNPAATKATRDGWRAHGQWEKDLPTLLDRLSGGQSEHTSTPV